MSSAKRRIERELAETELDPMTPAQEEEFASYGLNTREPRLDLPGGVPLGTIEASGALIMLGRLLQDYPKLGVSIRYREAGYDVDFHDETEPILRETAPVLRHALLAAMNRLLDEWLKR